MQWRTARSVAALLLIGLGVSETLSQQTQYPEAVQTPRTESSLNGLSDLRRKAEEGDSQAQFELGRIYMFALGVSRDYKQRQMVPVCCRTGICRSSVYDGISLRARQGSAPRLRSSS